MTRKPGLDEIGTARVAQEVNLTVETSGMTHDRFPCLPVAQMFQAWTSAQR